jgi:hypothetical protein
VGHCPITAAAGDSKAARYACACGPV